MTTIPRKPTKCDCRTPIWRFIGGAWMCLNCPLYVAIHERNDKKKAEIMRQIDATKKAR